MTKLMNLSGRIIQLIQRLSSSKLRNQPTTKTPSIEEHQAVEETCPEATKSGFNENALDQIAGAACSDCSIEELVEVARRLGRAISYKDTAGYDREIIGATISPDHQSFAYVEARAKKRFHYIAITIKVHFRDLTGRSHSADIKSYNPFFGCIIQAFHWIGDEVVLIYSEKHETYVCVFGEKWPPRFIAIEDRWILKDRVIGHIGHGESCVRRLILPQLSELDSVTIAEAEGLGICPEL